MRTLLLREGDLRKARDAREVYGLMQGEERFRNLGVPYEDFAGCLREGGGYGVGEVTRAVLNAYFAARKPGSRVWVVKDGANGYWVERISRELPEALFVHVVRDGRAVLNSGLNSASPYREGERMARDPLTLARMWSRFVSGVGDFAAAHPDRCAECRYEDLVADADGQVSALRGFFGLDEDGRVGHGAGYYERLPEKEKAIHGLVAREAVAGRASAWEEELSRGDRLVFEYRAFGALKRYGYDVVRRSLPQLLLEKAFLTTYVASVALRVRSWFGLVADTQKLRRVLATKALHRRGGKA